MYNLSNRIPGIRQIFQHLIKTQDVNMLCNYSNIADVDEITPRIVQRVAASFIIKDARDSSLANGTDVG